ncbi:MAG: hypothetical protein ACYTFI_17190 [Planctomycetota bacterium]|jgi:hypothetical protein
MASEEMLVRAENRPAAGVVDALTQYIETGTVPFEYLREVLGDWQESVGSSSASQPVRVVARKTWHGRPVHTDEEMASIECQYPPDPDL